MAIAFTNLGASAVPDTTSATDAASYTVASWTPPTTGIILLAFIGNRTGGAADAATVSGNSLTWTQIGSNITATGGNKLCLFAAIATGATTGTTVIDWGANTQTHFTGVFCQVTGADTSGGLAAAFVQTPSGTGTGTTGTVTLAAAGNANNRPFVAFHHTANEAKTPRSLWTELDDLGGVGAVRNLETQYRSDAFETTATATWTTSTTWAGIAVEIKNLASGTTYNQAEAGTVTPTGVDVKRTNKVEAGTVTPSGVVNKLTSKNQAGTVTPSGVDVKRTGKPLAGTLTPTGVLASIRTVILAIGGTLTTAGNLARTTGKTIAGTVTSAGALVRRTNKLEAGTITPAGALAKRTLKALAGVLTPAGNLAKRIGKALAGVLTTVGALATEKLGPARASVFFTLPERTISFTLAAGRKTLALATRSRAFTVAAGRRAFTLEKRVRQFTLQDK